MKKFLILLLAIILSACQSTNVKSSRAVVINQFTGAEGIELGANLYPAIQRIRNIIIPKVRQRSKKIVLHVGGYENFIDGRNAVSPVAGVNGNPMPRHQAYTVFANSGVDVVSSKCPPSSIGSDKVHLQVTSAITAFDQRINFQRHGWETSGESGTSSGVYDTSNWSSVDQQGLLTQAEVCGSKQLVFSSYYPIKLEAKNTADSFLFFSKTLGIYHTDNKSSSAGAQLNRDRAVMVGMLELAAKLAGLSIKELELAFFGFSSTYDEERGVLKTVYVDRDLDPSQVSIAFIAKYFGQDNSEVSYSDFGPVIDLTMKPAGIVPSKANGVRSLFMKLDYEGNTVYRKALL